MTTERKTKLKTSWKNGRLTVSESFTFSAEDSRRLKEQVKIFRTSVHKWFVDHATGYAGGPHTISEAMEHLLKDVGGTKLEFACELIGNADAGGFSLWNFDGTPREFLEAFIERQGHENRKLAERVVEHALRHKGRLVARDMAILQKDYG